MTQTAATVSVPEAARLLGVSKNAAYDAAARDGQLAGIPVIRVGPKRLVVPRAPLEALLGLKAPDNDISTDSR